MGTSLARKLDRQGYEVCAIDQDPERLKALGPTFGGQTVAGVGFDREVLAAAGIDRASAVIACTASDETNIVVARISRQTYRVPRVIARLYEIGNAETYRRLGIQSISTTDWGVRRVCELLTFNELDDVTGIGSGDVRLVRADVPPMLEAVPFASSPPLARSASSPSLTTTRPSFPPRARSSTTVTSSTPPSRRPRQASSAPCSA